MIEYRVAKLKDFQARADSGPGWEGGFDGLLSVFGVTDTYGTRFQRGAFVAGGLDDGLYPLLFQHGPADRREWDVNRVIGTFTAREDGDNLRMTAKFAKTQAGQDARELAAMGAATDLSHGFENRVDNPHDKREIIQCRLVEGSLVVTRIGSTPGAGVTDVRTAETRVLAGSIEALQAAIQDALDSAKPGDGWNWIRATYSDSVVWEWSPEDGENVTYQAPYTVADDGTVTIGDRAEVEVTEVLSNRSRLAAKRASARLRLSVPILRR